MLGRNGKGFIRHVSGINRGIGMVVEIVVGPEYMIAVPDDSFNMWLPSERVRMLLITPSYWFFSTTNTGLEA